MRWKLKRWRHQFSRPWQELHKAYLKWEQKSQVCLKCDKKVWWYSLPTRCRVKR